MSCEQQLCLSVGGCRCGAFMSPLFRDLHPTCARCRGTKCSADMTCNICKDWSVAHWESFLKKRSYSGRRKKRPSGSALSTAPPTLPPSTSASAKAGGPAPPLRPPTPLSEGRGRFRESEGVPHVGSREVSTPPSRRSVGEEEDGGGGGGGARFLGAQLIRLLLPSWGWSSRILSLAGVACAC